MRASSAAVAQRQAPVQQVLRRLSEFLRYGLSSGLALGLDYALLVVLTEGGGLHYFASAAIGFCAGMILIYALSVSFVFEQRRLTSAAAEFTRFVTIGLLGLCLNQLLLWLVVSSFSLSYALAKIPTAGVVFLFNFTARRALLFSTKT
jgi:putative flippase GtrA